MHHQNATKIAASSHDPRSKLGHLVKDLYYTLDLGREARTSLPIAELVSPIYTAGLREHGEKATSPVSEAGRRPA
jgi:3-hydroxyisobutyrate dehydrogenase-like beta-hydroxyacid dehydrogenase